MSSRSGSRQESLSAMSRTPSTKPPASPPTRRPRSGCSRSRYEIHPRSSSMRGLTWLRSSSGGRQRNDRGSAAAQVGRRSGGRPAGPGGRRALPPLAAEGKKRQGGREGSSPFAQGRRGALSRRAAKEERRRPRGSPAGSVAPELSLPRKE